MVKSKILAYLSGAGLMLLGTYVNLNILSSSETSYLQLQKLEASDNCVYCPDNACLMDMTSMGNQSSSIRPDYEDDSCDNVIAGGGY